MFTSEQAFDMLPHAVDIYDKLNMDAYRKEVVEKHQSQKPDQKEVGIEVIKYIIKNSPKIKEECFHIIAVAEGKTVEEIKKRPVLETVKVFNSIISDESLMDFFKSAMP